LEYLLRKPLKLQESLPNLHQKYYHRWSQVIHQRIRFHVEHGPLKGE
jgi:hypothetical protein